MKRYRLLKDLPNLKKGTIFSEDNSFFGARVFTTKTKKSGINFIGNDFFEEFLEEIKELTDSIHWKPKCGEEYWIVNSYGLIVKRIWSDSNEDLNMYKLGIVHPTKEECEKAHDRELAEVRLRRTSNFKPNFKNGNGGWVVMYDHFERVLAIECYSFCDSGEPVRYETEEEALKSIKENEQDWLIYFGIKEER